MSGEAVVVKPWSTGRGRYTFRFSEPLEWPTRDGTDGFVDEVDATLDLDVVRIQPTSDRERYMVREVPLVALVSAVINGTVALCVERDPLRILHPDHFIVRSIIDGTCDLPERLIDPAMLADPASFLIPGLDDHV